jgi:sec-independent protein translocase protein TatC
MAGSKGEMGFLDHLEELRWRIVKSLLAIVVFAVPCGIYWRYIFNFIMVYPLRFAKPAPHIIYTNPTETVVLSIKIAIAGGIVCASPVVFYQLWRFMSPGLYKNEKVVILPTVFASTFFFLLGISFCYFVLPYILNFLTNYAGAQMEAMYKVQDYMDFFLKLAISFGIVFELPVLSFVLTKFGIITPSFLTKYYRYAIVIIFIVAAILTPPDVLSQLVMATPLLVLYGISILVSYAAQGKKKS